MHYLVNLSVDEVMDFLGIFQSALFLGFDRQVDFEAVFKVGLEMASK